MAPGHRLGVADSALSEQVREAVAATGVRLDAGTLAAIDAALGEVIERDPALTVSPEQRP